MLQQISDQFLEITFLNSLKQCAQRAYTITKHTADCVPGALNAIVFGMDKETASRLTPAQIRVSVCGVTSSHSASLHCKSQHKGPLTFGSAGGALPSHNCLFFTKNPPQMPILPNVRDPQALCSQSYYRCCLCPKNSLQAFTVYVTTPHCMGKGIAPSQITALLFSGWKTALLISNNVYVVNYLEFSTSYNLYIDFMHKEHKLIWEIHEHCKLIFQNI